ncbi:aldolase/citrate lyase family protein [Streptomyces sp. NPDC093544]|uniref:HpcH/HpaI aldolase family protein n=1 Tax=Streptomyces sp. NPDC093544 TaxID=3155200 RepID=UPI003446E10C
MNAIKAAVAAGHPSLGLWSCVGSTLLAEVAGRAGMDWVLFDTQHGAVSDGDLLACIQAVELGGSAPLVRVGANDPRLIMRALDLGAAGVVVPLVSSAQEAADMVAAVRYPPLGTRSFGPVRSFYDLGHDSGSPLCLAMIETAAGLADVDAIAATPGLDGLFLGPVDLALDLGHALADAWKPDVLRGPVERVVAAAERHGVVVGAPALSTEMAEWLLAAGVQLVSIGSDIGHVTAGFAADAKRRDDWRDRYHRPRTRTEPACAGTKSTGTDTVR